MSTAANTRRLLYRDAQDYKCRGEVVFRGAPNPTLVERLTRSFVAGALSERGQDRSLATAVPAMLASTATVYLFGVSGLVVYLGVGSTEALELGLLPFLVGDVLKVLLAAAVLPAA